jgi:hypothetical protein
MKKKLILVSLLSFVMVLALIPLSMSIIGLSQDENVEQSETQAQLDWWVGYNAGFEVTQSEFPDPEICDLLPVGSPECYPLPDGTVIGLKVIVNNLHRLYHYDIQATGIGYEHLKVFRVLDSDLDYSLNPQPNEDKLWFRYGYDLALPSGTTQFESRAWFGFEESQYGTGENSAWVFEWTGVSFSSGEISLSLDFIYLMQNRGTHPSVNSPPEITVLTSIGLQSSQYNTFSSS